MNSTYELIFVCYANQTISFRKLRPLESPVCIINRIADALSDFFHRVKLVAASFLLWGLSRPCFPQSTKFGLCICIYKL